jgi:hypothetical protein
VTSIMPRHVALLPCFIFLTAIVTSTLAQGLDAGDDLSIMTAAELAKIEETLKREVAETDIALAAIREDTELLEEGRHAIDAEVDRLRAESQREEKEKARLDKELEMSRVDVKIKKAAIAKMHIRVAELKAQIGTLERTLAELVGLNAEAERRYQDPSLADVLDSRSQEWGNLSRNLYSKTKTNIFPVFSKMKIVASQYRRRVIHASRALELLASLLVYGFVVLSCYVVYRLYSIVRGNITVDRLLFMGDSICACFWSVVLICFFMFFRDPLVVIQEQSPAAFFVFQLLAICSYTTFVLLRVLVLASKMTMAALGETLAVVVIGQHYYVRVWQPSMLNESPHGTIFYYLCYAAMFSACARNRTDSFSPLKQIGGPRLRVRDLLRILYRRMTNIRIAHGDLTSFETPVLVADDVPTVFAPDNFAISGEQQMHISLVDDRAQ